MKICDDIEFVSFEESIPFDFNKLDLNKYFLNHIFGDNRIIGWMIIKEDCWI